MKDRLNLGKMIPVSTIDWYGKVVSVIFFRRCPLRCVYCQNYTLLEGANYVKLSEMEKEIGKSKDFIDGVVFSGGEPFEQFEAMRHLARFTGELSLMVGIETNGFYPDKVEIILKEEIVDKVFLDVKAPLSEPGLYEKICRTRGVVDRVRESIGACDGRVELEIRTTAFRGLVGGDEVKKIALDLKDIDCEYVIQQGIPEQAWEEGLRNLKAYSEEELIQIAKSAILYLRDVKIRSKKSGEIAIS
ncbi:MAG: anaerobic ribonucleoside-triphosphate reductase activating protein [Halobacteriota archaeon]|nr:anaerobic ribonucleoside-triphosphate reductase activating protein [Halobacteriota archaeon]